MASDSKHLFTENDGALGISWPLACFFTIVAMFAVSMARGMAFRANGASESIFSWPYVIGMFSLFAVYVPVEVTKYAIKQGRTPTLWVLYGVLHFCACYWAVFSMPI